MKKKIAKLIDVKSIMTLSLTLGFMGLTLFGSISGEEYMDIFKTIVIFYFGTQAAKNTKEDTE